MSDRTKIEASGLSIVIPVYNEEKFIRETIQSIEKAMNGKSIPYEIIVVDDGSSDNSKSIVQEMDVVLIEHERNLGYGAALKTGFSCAKYKWIAIVDADGTYPCSEVGKLYEYIPEYKMVVGSRTGKMVKIPLIRKPAKIFINFLASYLIGQKIPDLNSGFRIISKELVLKNLKIIPDGFSFTATITLIAFSNNKKIKYLPINYFKRKGISKFRPFRDTLNFITLIIRTILYFNPIKIFIPLSFLLFLSSFSVLTLSYLFSPKIMDLTTIILFLAGIQTLSLGMVADLINRKIK